MGSKMLIDAAHPEETRVVVVRGNRIEEFDYESAHRKQLKGNIYLAKVTRVEPSLQAAFVDYGGNRHGFLAFSEIHPDYYQIPIADRQALVREEAAEARRSDEEFDRTHDDGGSEAGRAETAAVAAGGDGEAGQGDDMEPAAAADEGGAGVESVEEEPDNRSVDQVGAEDALEEVPERRRQARRAYKIQEVIKRRQIMLVQVVKEERGTKGAALTTYLSLAGRYCVLMPNTARGGGISRKITDPADRKRLKEVAREVEVPEGMGLIIRTAGAQRTKAEIKRDYDYLMRLWKNVRDLTLKSTAPSLVYEEGSLIKRAIRDLYTKDVDEIIVDGEAGYREAKEFMKMLMPSHARNVKLHKEPRPLFSRYKIDSQLDGLFSPVVTLQSGGYLVLNQTEALVSIDINSGKSTREHNIEDTALRTNLEAADEIARQLRLRDLAGLIVIDFIDMEEKRNNRSVERRLKEALKHDRARIQVGRISHFGLLEMSRQRLRQGMLEGSTRPCPHCEGTGLIRSVSSCALSVLRGIEEQLMGRRAENLTVYCHPEVATYILNDKRDHLLSLEQTYGVSIFIVPRESVRPSDSEIERAVERAGLPRRIAGAEAVRIDSAYVEEEVGEAAEAEAAAEVEAAAETAAAAEAVAGPEADGEAQRRRRRRRGRRGGRRSRDRVEAAAGGVAAQPASAAEEAAPPEAAAQPSTAEEVAGAAEQQVTAEVAPAEKPAPQQRRPRRTKPAAEPHEADDTAEVAVAKRRREPRRRKEEPAPPDAAPEPEPVGGNGAEEPAATQPAVVEPAIRPVAVEAGAAGEARPDEREPEAEPRRRWQPPAPTARPTGPARSGWWRRRDADASSSE